MAIRAFGPKQAPGVRVEERQGERPLIPSQLGVTGYVGILEKGPIGELIECPNKRTLERKTGGFISDSLLPDACREFFAMSQNSGELQLVRVADGNQRLAYYDKKYWSIQSATMAERTVRTLRNRRSPAQAVIEVKAKNEGRWGGKSYVGKFEVDDFDLDILDPTPSVILRSNMPWPKDFLKGGVLKLAEVTTKSYQIIGNENTPVSPGTPVDTTIYLALDETPHADLPGSPADKEFTVELTNGEKYLSIEIGDGGRDPANEWSMKVYQNGNLMLNYENLSSDPTSQNYFKTVINEDTENHEITVEDLWTGGIDATVRPANLSGNASAVTANTATVDIVEATYPIGKTAVLSALAYGAEAKADEITLTFSSDTAFDGVSALYGDLGAGTTATSYPGVTAHKFGFVFTISAGTPAFAATDVVTIYFRPLPDCTGGLFYPNIDDNPDYNYVIQSNTVEVITLRSDVNIIADPPAAAIGKLTRIALPLALNTGYDGIEDTTTLKTAFENAFDLVTSPFLNLAGLNKGLVKLATPGVMDFFTATGQDIQNKGLIFAEANNYQFRVEIPSTKTDDVAAEAWLSSNIGKQTFGVVSFPSYGYYMSPETKLQKLIPLTGSIQGLEAYYAVTWDGYHKAAAGIEAVLSNIVKLAKTDRPDLEYLNPRGVNGIISREGKFILWGDRSMSSESSWIWKHQRELMSHYEHVLQDNWDFIIFAINDKDTWQLVVTVLTEYFRDEWNKRAIRGDTLDDAAIIKCDAEINTTATMAAGDLYAEIALRLADTVERLIIRISKQGIFEAV